MISVTIPSSVTTIGKNAFRYCTSLTTVFIPNSVTSIGDCAFASCCSLTSIILPIGVTTIGGSAFAGCSSLEKVTVNAETPPVADEYTFSNYNIPLYVPEASINAYQTTTPWSKFQSIVATGIRIKEIDKQDIVSHYSIDGKQQQKLNKGINVIRTCDGRTKKEMVK